MEVSAELISGVRLRLQDLERRLTTTLARMSPEDVARGSRLATECGKQQRRQPGGPYLWQFGNATTRGWVERLTTATGTRSSPVQDRGRVRN